MKIQAKIYQETISKAHFYNGETVRKKRHESGNIMKDLEGNPIWETLDGQRVEAEDIETVTTTRESFSFPVSAESKNKTLTEQKLQRVCDHMAEILVQSADTAFVKGRKFTTFSLNKPIHIAVNLDAVQFAHDKDIAQLLQTFRMTYSKDGQRERFSKEYLSEGLQNIIKTAVKANEHKNLDKAA